MSQATENFFGMAIFVPLVSILLLFGACELVCNSVGYTLISDVVGSFDPNDEPYSDTQELSWKCAGFRRKASNDWGYSGQYDHAACRALRTSCSEERMGCDEWEHIQQGKIGWGEDNHRWFGPIDNPYKRVDVELLVGDESRKSSGRRERSERHQKAVELAPQANPSSGTLRTTQPASVSRYETDRPARSRVGVSDPIHEIEIAIEAGSYRSARKLIKEFTAVAGVECEDAALLAGQGGVTVAISRLQRVLRNLVRLQAVLSRSKSKFRGRARLGRKLDEAHAALSVLVQEMKQSVP